MSFCIICLLHATWCCNVHRIQCFPDNKFQYRVFPCMKLYSWSPATISVTVTNFPACEVLEQRIFSLQKFIFFGFLYRNFPCNMFKRSYFHYSFLYGWHVPQLITNYGPFTHLCAICGPFLIHGFCYSVFTNWRAVIEMSQQGLNFKCRKILLHYMIMCSG